MTTYDQYHVDSLVDEIIQKNQKIKEQAREIEVLTTERDNALLAVEGLERELLEAEATRYSPTEW